MNEPKPRTHITAEQHRKAIEDFEREAKAIGRTVWQHFCAQCDEIARIMDAEGVNMLIVPPWRQPKQ